MTGPVAGAGASLPVVFFNGDSEIDAGDVVIFPSLEFKAFQAIISHKIGISPHQISIYLDHPAKKPRSFSDRRKRSPITSKVNFASVLRHRDSFFIAVLKKPRTERRRRRKHHHQHAEEALPSEADSSNPEKLVLLRRGEGMPSPFAGYFSPLYGQIVPLDYFGLQKQRENYMNAMGSAIGLRSSSPIAARQNRRYAAPCEEGIHTRNRFVCEDCSRAKEEGRTVPFHWCVLDAVTVGFRSLAGPISRPVKYSR